MARPFEDVWKSASVRTAAPVSAGLRPLVEQVYIELMRDMAELPPVKDALVALLRFLCSQGGYTQSNLVATGRVLTGLSREWTHLPGDYQAALTQAAAVRNKSQDQLSSLFLFSLQLDAASYDPLDPPEPPVQPTGSPRR